MRKYDSTVTVTHNSSTLQHYNVKTPTDKRMLKNCGKTY